MPKYIIDHSSYTNFRLAVIGQGFDMDGHYGYQCWDGVDLLYDQYGETLLTASSYGGDGYAYTCWSNEDARRHNTTPHFMPQITSINDVKRGDIVVFKPYGTIIGETGHIAFADEDYKGDGTLRILGQNQYPGSNPTTGQPFNIWQLNVASEAFIGGWKVEEWQTPTTVYKRKHKYPWFIHNRKRFNMV